MTDPSLALDAFQKDLTAGRLPLQQGQLDGGIFVLLDFPNKRPRFTYLTIEKEMVTALAMLALVEPVKGDPCFQLGIAVLEQHRGQGRAKKLVRSAIAELQYGSAKNNVTAFHVEAVVGIDNIVSQKVAAACISGAPAPITDQVSGLPALHYIKKFQTS